MFLSLFAAYMPQRSNGADLHSGFAAIRSFLLTLCTYFFSIPASTTPAFVVALQPVLTVQPIGRPLGVPGAWGLRFDPSLASQPRQVVSCRPPVMFCVRRTSSRKNDFATYLVLLVFFKPAFQSPCYGPFFFRQPYVAITRLAYFLPFPAFLGQLLRLAPRYRPRVPDVWYLATAFFFVVFSVPYLLSGARHFQQCFELNEYLSCRPHFLLALFMVE